MLRPSPRFRRTRAVQLFVVAIVGAATALAVPSLATADETVSICVDGVNHAFVPGGSGSYVIPIGCPLEIEAVGNLMSQGTGASGQADAPSGLEIVAAGVSLYSHDVNDGNTGQYGGAFYWDGGFPQSAIKNPPFIDPTVANDQSPVYVTPRPRKFERCISLGVASASEGDLQTIGRCKADRGVD